MRPRGRYDRRELLAADPCDKGSPASWPLCVCHRDTSQGAPAVDEPQAPTLRDEARALRARCCWRALQAGSRVARSITSWGRGEGGRRALPTSRRAKHRVDACMVMIPTRCYRLCSRLPLTAAPLKPTEGVHEEGPDASNMLRGGRPPALWGPVSRAASKGTRWSVVLCTRIQTHAWMFRPLGVQPSAALPQAPYAPLPFQGLAQQCEEGATLHSAPNAEKRCLLQSARSGALSEGQPGRHQASLHRRNAVPGPAALHPWTGGHAACGWHGRKEPRPGAASRATQGGRLQNVAGV